MQNNSMHMLCSMMDTLHVRITKLEALPNEQPKTPEQKTIYNLYALYTTKTNNLDPRATGMPGYLNSDSLTKVLLKLGVQNKHFVDFGAGDGRAIIAAKLLGASSVEGYEYPDNQSIKDLIWQPMQKNIAETFNLSPDDMGKIQYNLMDIKNITSETLHGVNTAGVNGTKTCVYAFWFGMSTDDQDKILYLCRDNANIDSLAVFQDSAHSLINFGDVLNYLHYQRIQKEWTLTDTFDTFMNRTKTLCWIFKKQIPEAAGGVSRTDSSDVAAGQIPEASGGVPSDVAAGATRKRDPSSSAAGKGSQKRHTSRSAAHKGSQKKDTSPSSARKDSQERDNSSSAASTKEGDGGAAPVDAHEIIWVSDDEEKQDGATTTSTADRGRARAQQRNRDQHDDATAAQGDQAGASNTRGNRAGASDTRGDRGGAAHEVSTWEITSLADLPYTSKNKVVNDILTQYFIDNDDAKRTLQRTMQEIHKFSSQCLKVVGEYPKRKVIAQNVKNWQPVEGFVALFCGEILSENDVEDQSYSCDISLNNGKTGEYVLDCTPVALYVAKDKEQELLQDKAKKLGHAHLLQHRCVAHNCILENLKIQNGKSFITVPYILYRHSTKPPTEGQELTIHYGDAYVKTLRQWMRVEWVKQLLEKGTSKEDIEQKFIPCECEDCIQSEKNDKKFMIKHTPLQEPFSAMEVSGGKRNRKQPVRWSYNEF